MSASIPSPSSSGLQQNAKVLEENRNYVDYKVRRLFNNGKHYTAIVLTNVAPIEIWDERKQKDVLLRTVRYTDGQTDELDEEQLKMWSHNNNITTTNKKKKRNNKYNNSNSNDKDDSDSDSNDDNGNHIDGQNSLTYRRKGTEKGTGTAKKGCIDISSSSSDDDNNEDDEEEGNEKERINQNNKRNGDSDSNDDKGNHIDGQNILINRRKGAEKGTGAGTAKKDCIDISSSSSSSDDDNNDDDEKERMNQNKKRSRESDSNDDNSNYIDGQNTLINRRKKNGRERGKAKNDCIDISSSSSEHDGDEEEGDKKERMNFNRKRSRENVNHSENTFQDWLDHEITIDENADRDVIGSITTASSSSSSFNIAKRIVDNHNGNDKDDDADNISTNNNSNKMTGRASNDQHQQQHQNQKMSNYELQNQNNRERNTKRAERLGFERSENNKHSNNTISGRSKKNSRIHKKYTPQHQKELSNNEQRIRSKTVAGMNNKNKDKNNNTCGVIQKGFKFTKSFDVIFDGIIISEEPFWKLNYDTNHDELVWKVKYVADGDTAFLTECDLNKLVADAATRERAAAAAVAQSQLPNGGASSVLVNNNNRSSITNPMAVESYDTALQDLTRRVSISKEEVVPVLDSMRPPYCLNTAITLIMKARGTSSDNIGSPRGRQLHALELFCGCAAVSKEFYKFGWMIRAIDNDPTTNATHHADIMTLNYENDIDTIPDFVWASPPCTTYTYLTGGHHRNPKNNEEYSKTDLAKDHDRMLAQIRWILKWMIQKKPHMIIVIENPVGYLAKMPLMKVIAKDLNLAKVTVDYCTLGRSDKKPTDLWTNNNKLRGALNPYQCKPETCPNHKKHPAGVRDDKTFNAAAIPKALAEIVAESVHCIFGVNDRNIRRETKEPTITADEIREFNKMMGKD